MLTIAPILSGFLVFCALAHVLVSLWAWRWSRPMPDGTSQNRSDFSPRVGVVLTVRGCDPSLRQTLIGLLRQAYAGYEIWIVVDHQTDSAWKVLEQTIAEFDRHGRCHLLELQSPPSTCGLKCAALVQAVEAMEGCEILATIDADIIPHPRWLADLVQPLRDPKVGVVTGNHWFAPSCNGVGSHLRSIWNAGALVPTAIFANPWAGTCAMRLADIESSELIDRWRTSIVDDGPIRSAMRRLGKRVVFLPTLIMVNRESCSFRYFVDYVARILTWSRVYESSFVFTVGHAAINVGVWAAAWTMLAIYVGTGAVASALTLGTAIGLHWILMFAAYVIVFHGVRKLVERRAESIDPVSARRWMQLFLLIPIAWLVHAWGVYRAIAVRQISWRKIRYELQPGGRVIMTQYKPWVESAEHCGTGMSI